MSALPDSESSLRHFRLSAAAEPGLLPRVLELLAKRGLVPERLRAERRGDALLVELAAELPEEVAPLVAASLGCMVGVTLLAVE